MTDDDMLNALAAKHPALRRCIAEYVDDGEAAIARFMRDHPVEAIAFMADLFEANRNRPADS